MFDNAIQSYLNSRYPETSWRVYNTYIIGMSNSSATMGILLYHPPENYAQLDNIARMLLQPGLFRKNKDSFHIDRGEPLKTPFEMYPLQRH